MRWELDWLVILLTFLQLYAATPFAITAVLSDVCITIALCVLLHGNRSSVVQWVLILHYWYSWDCYQPRTNALVNTLIVYAINRCLLTSYVPYSLVTGNCVNFTSYLLELLLSQKSSQWVQPIEAEEYTCSFCRAVFRQPAQFMVHCDRFCYRKAWVANLRFSDDSSLYFYSICQFLPCIAEQPKCFTRAGPSQSQRGHEYPHQRHWSIRPRNIKRR